MSPGSEQVVPELGKSAPHFASVDSHGTPVRLADLRGTPVVLVFVPYRAALALL